MNSTSSTYENISFTMESNSSDTASSKFERDDADVSEKKDSAAEGSDEKEVISKLRRSNSVSAKASLFQQLARESKKACEEGLLKKRTGIKDASPRTLAICSPRVLIN